MSELQIKTDQLLKELKSRGELPQKMDIAQVAGRYWFVSRDLEQENIISENSTTGFSDDPTVALLKSLSERFERSAFREGFKDSLDICKTDRSDGFAAFPRFDENAGQKARQSAFAEAIERFVWANWWDHHQYRYTLSSIDKESQLYAEEVKKHCEAEELFVVKPKISNQPDYEVIIIFARLRFGGFVSGGACGLKAKRKMTELRALDELYRHGLALQKIKVQKLTPMTFYEKRLAYFGLGHGNQLIRERFDAKGSMAISLPDLEFDAVVQHSLDDLFLVHRCLFKNQPPFMGGAVERFCL
jgi:hypothetical protein